MNNLSDFLRIARVLLGLVLAALASTVIYTLASYGAGLFFPFIFFVGGTAFSLTLLVYAPVYLILLAKSWTKFWQVVGSAFLVTLTVFLIGSLMAHKGFKTLQSGGRDLVLEGKITMAGYLNLLTDAALVAAIGAVGGVVFWLVAHSQNRQSEKRA